MVMSIYGLVQTQKNGLGPFVKEHEDNSLNITIFFSDIALRVDFP